MCVIAREEKTVTHSAKEVVDISHRHVAGPFFQSRIVHCAVYVLKRHRLVGESKSVFRPLR